MSHSKKPMLSATALAGGLILAGSAFAATPLAQGYMLGTQSTPTAEKAADASCGAKHAAGNCGGMMMRGHEGGCGMAMMDANKDGKITRAEFDATHAGKFAQIDTNKDGVIDAAEMKAHHQARMGAAKAGEGKCGEGKCGASADKKPAEGKCGEGKCGSM
ncbi:hypothetical protein [Aerolutibacter daejeonensis]|uniref:HvfA family oxazolone/thioamide-modified RiPP metallophore n=1 Tax=Aerolutibacter daejeonensis TaxID=346181 RepID=UPI00068ED75E|nr:hypothetical protein [Lysobacter daejeonensis]